MELDPEKSDSVVQPNGAIQSDQTAPAKKGNAQAFAFV